MTTAPTSGKTGVCCQNAKLHQLSALCAHLGFSAFCFPPLLARPLVRLALWLLSRRKEGAVVYQYRGVTSIGKQPFCLLVWICHARRLQPGSEACAIQQEVRRKSTQELLRTSQHGFNVKIGLHFGLNLVSPWSQHGVNSQLGLNMLSTWSQFGRNIKTNFQTFNTNCGRCSNPEKRVSTGVACGNTIAQQWRFFIEKNHVFSQHQGNIQIECGVVLNITTMRTLNTPMTCNAPFFTLLA